jgi:hypothetical protein
LSIGATIVRASSRRLLRFLNHVLDKNFAAKPGEFFLFFVKSASATTWIACRVTNQNMNTKTDSLAAMTIQKTEVGKRRLALVGTWVGRAGFGLDLARAPKPANV